ncbi:MAG: cupin domain-containing protein [Gammaproteobacteria bacterium]|nr:cupin domain-containing protein [Gammaproteobacteria bacterium]
MSNQLKHMRFGIVVLLVLGCASAVPNELLRTSKTWEGGEIVYPSGEPQVTSVKLSIAQGQTTAFHCHPVPTLGYILTGKVKVETPSGKHVILNKGESAVEVMRTLHRATALGGPVEIIVFYAGAKSIPNTVLPANDPEHHYCSAQPR